MSKKIKKTKVQKTSKSGIELTKLKPKGISFSFKYHQDKRPKFSIDRQATTYWLAFIDRLKALSGLYRQELLVNRSQALRFHPIKWEDTSETGFGLPNEEQLVDTPYQFSLSANVHGRVHGFMIDEVFYIVWLDPGHLLYPAKD